ncbi:MAG: hypothetical protein ABW321_10360 [Polyangiales bacterium]
MKEKTDPSEAVRATQELELSAEALLRALQARGIPLPSEIAAFITLEACEHVLDRPAALGARDVVINETGEVFCPEAPPTAAEDAAVAALLGMLSDFLLSAAPGVPSMLLELIEPGPARPVRSLDELHGRLEACLMPLNRGATRRVIARLVRDTRKPAPGPRSDAAQPPSAAELDAQFDSLVGNLAPPSGEQRPSGSRPALRGRSSRAPGARARAQPHVATDLAIESESTRARVGVWVFGLTTLASIGLLVAYFVVGRDELVGQAPPVAAGRAQLASQPAPPARTSYGDLLIDSRPVPAQVFLLIGRGPVVASDLPLGVAHELVALADGHAPARALVPADAAWDDVDGQPRYELAIQAKPLLPGAPPTAALGASLMPRDPGTPNTRLGSVRVVTTPRGANVYQLIGFTPGVRLSNLRLDRGYELLVYSEGRRPVTRRITANDFREQDGRLVARLDLRL